MRVEPGRYQWNTRFNERHRFLKGVDPATQNGMIVMISYKGLLACSHELENCEDKVIWLEVLW